MNFWTMDKQQTSASEQPKTMLRNKLTITFFNGQTFRQWYDNWDGTDPRTAWEPIYHWFLHESTPLFVVNADVDAHENLGLSLDYILRRDEIRTMEFSLSEEPNEL